MLGDLAKIDNFLDNFRELEENSNSSTSADKQASTSNSLLPLAESTQQKNKGRNEPNERNEMFDSTKTLDNPLSYGYKRLIILIISLIV